MKIILYSLLLVLIWTTGRGQGGTPTVNPCCGPKSAALEGQTIFAVSEQMPQFPGGKEAINHFIISKIQVSAEEKPKRPIFVSFVVDTTGQVVNACIMKPLSEKPTPVELEVLRVVQLLPKWIPGQQGRKKVPVNWSIPVRL